jgi:hypothetical protein
VASRERRQPVGDKSRVKVGRVTSIENDQDKTEIIGQKARASWPPQEVRSAPKSVLTNQFLLARSTSYWNSSKTNSTPIPRPHVVGGPFAGRDSETPDDEATESEELEHTSDPCGCTLREIGRVPLLNREGK